MEIYYGIQLDNGAKYRAKGDESLALKVGDYCVIRKDFFQDYGQIVKQYPVPQAKPGEPLVSVEPPAGDSFSQREPQLGLKDASGLKKAETPVIIRKATVVDQGKANENQMRAKSSMRTTAQHVERLQLPMKLINAHYAFDGKLIQIQFSAEGRVDFRELVKVLSQEFNTRIELRQIGVRDETSIFGGISVCGRPLCCALFLTEFASINVKMAKEQDLALTPSSISGACGRLKCCLKYEHEGYLELEKTMPRRGDCCECSEGRGRVIDRNLLTQKVTIQLEDNSHSVVCDAKEVRVVYPEKFKMQPSQDEKEIEAMFAEDSNAKPANDRHGGNGFQSQREKRNHSFQDRKNNSGRNPQNK